MTLTPDTRLEPHEQFSIGDVATLTGVATDTIRAWERRYGRPEPIRLTSGHRRYTAGQVRWLRQVAAALAHGHRPSAVVRLSEPEIAALLDRPGAPARVDPDIDDLLALTRAFDGTAIRSLLQRRWAELGARRFLVEFVEPALERVGDDWAAGRIDIRHEHFLSGILEDELRAFRSSLRPREEQPVVIFATLSGEHHGLGLQIASLIGVLGGASARILGTNVPVEQIAEAASESRAEAVAVSVSLATGGVETDRTLGSLRALLPRGVQLIVGGRGSRGVRRGNREITYFQSLEDFERWLASRAGRAASS